MDQSLKSEVGSLRFVVYNLNNLIVSPPLGGVKKSLKFKTNIK